LVLGNPQMALARMNSIVISEAAASKYFGSDNPIGKEMTLNNEVSLTVTGVTKNILRTSSLHFDYLVTLETIEVLSGGLEDWKNNKFASFVMLPEGYDKTRVEEKLPAFMAAHMEESPESPGTMYLFPYLDFRLKGNHITTFMFTSIYAATYIALFIGIVLLSIVCFNFINLSIARHMYRAKEIGLRKVLGARRFQLVKQFFGESILLSLIAIPIAIVIYELIQPVYTAYLGNFASLGLTTEISSSIWNYPFLLKYLLIAALFTGVISGFYPAIFLSSFQPAEVLKGNINTGRKKNRGQKVMIFFQFSVSIIFVIIASIVSDQLSTILNSDFGYSRENIGVLQIGTVDDSKKELLKTELSRFADVTLVSAAGNIPGLWDAPQPAFPDDENKNNAITLQSFGVDYGFVEILEIEILRGRSFSKDYADGNNFIINETAAERFGWENPVGRKLTVGEKTGTVIGVARDFLFGDIDFSIPPAVLTLESGNQNVLLVKFTKNADFEGIRTSTEEMWMSIAPEIPFEYYTLEEYFSGFFEILDSIAVFISIVGFLIMFFACIGLFGLASYMIERRTKEIGIRKVLGASMISIIWGFAKEYLYVVAVANVIILPLVYYGWSRILQFGLLFITELSAGTYFFATFVSLFFALAAVIYQTMKVVLANPVDALRNE